MSKETPAVDFKSMNICQKLNAARLKFLQNGVQKSGKNYGIGFSYFELADIVPAATEIFNEVGLTTMVNYSESEATMTLINADTIDQILTFRTPMRFTETNKGVNPLQALGASHTYIRRYLYMMVLDICEADSIDGDATEKKAEPAAKAKPAEPVAKKTESKKPAKKGPATAEERAEVKEELTAVATNGNAPAELCQQVMEICKRLHEKDPGNDEFIQQVADMTEGFTVMTTEQANNLLVGLKEMESE